ncbi:hypothetical protein QMK19_40960 [Streptomyces sp. H10-C2]|uniref:hypothetical protein n=1 Tax=unclassified Streptomyces TaxID=2593676 RepID=UPI0024BA87B0|nr:MULTISPECIES: hypothetical protein [unclassified Streptomyces]MDJ0347559.1 hypothetical protein [Streptomyces sp. PH10-H1]MDJ0375770.1 hypothetical protein [Streptomyces sp. H10-C2]
MSDTTIKVDSLVRDRLAELARERGTSIRDLVGDLAETTPTRQELQARFDAAKTYVEDHFLEAPLTAGELAQAEQWWQDIASGAAGEIR